MDIRQLEYFVAVVEEANFTRAADRVHVAQPGVSAQIRRLERELGQDLLDRSGRTVRVTDVGAAVLPYARAALDAVVGARQVVEELTGLLRGRVAVGMVTACGVGDVPELLARFHHRHPQVEITLTEDDTDQLIDAVRDGRLDLALVGLAAYELPGLTTRVLADEPVVAAVAPDHELAAEPAVTLEMLHKHQLICLPPGSGVRSLLDDAFALAGLRPRVAFEASSLAMQARLAARGLGVAVVPASTIAVCPEDLRALPLEPERRGGIGWVWRSGGPGNPAARALVAHLDATENAVAENAVAGNAVATGEPAG